jgi:hypothetical protein
LLCATIGSLSPEKATTASTDGSRNVSRYRFRSRTGSGVMNESSVSISTTVPW